MDMTQPKDEQKAHMTVTLPTSEATHIYALLKLDWPVAERIMVKLGALIVSCTGGQPIGQGILEAIVEHSVREYGQALYSKKNGKCPDHLRIRVFTDCLLEETYRFIRSGQIAMAGGATEMPDASTERELRHSLYELLICDSLKRILKESSFEKAILDSGPSAND